MAYGVVLFPGTACPVPDVANIIFIQYEMFNVWDTVSIIVHIARMFLSTDFRFVKRIGLVSMVVFYIIFSYYTQDKNV